MLRDIPDWDVLDLTDMAEDSEFRLALKDRFGGRAGIYRSARISHLTLPESWEVYLAAQNHHRRAGLRQARRKFEKQPGARFFVWDDAARLDAAIDRLIELHHLRWKGRDEHHAFSSTEYISFHRAAMHAFAAQGWLRLYCLEVAGELVAIYHCFRFRRKVFHFQGGFDPAHKKWSPGLVLMSMAIEHAMLEGNTNFDMLRGEYEYKTQWAKEQRETFGCLVYRPRPAALVERAARDWVPALRRRIKRTIGLQTPTSAPEDNSNAS